MFIPYLHSKNSLVSNVLEFIDFIWWKLRQLHICLPFTVEEEAHEEAEEEAPKDEAEIKVEVYKDKKIDLPWYAFLSS